MIYLSVFKLESHIKLNIIADLIGEDPTTFTTGSTSSILDDLERDSIAETKLYLDNYYDFDKIISGSTQIQIYTRMLIDVFLFNLFQRANIDQMPTGILYNYEGTIKQLKDIAMRKLNPSDFPVKNNKYVATTMDISTSDIKINFQD